jgi:hypothetical protein
MLLFCIYVKLIIFIVKVFNFMYTQASLRIGFLAGLKAAANRRKKRGAVLFNTAPFFLFDLRRFEPAKKPILQLTWV